MFKFIKGLFKKKEKTSTEETITNIYIPKYIKKLEERYNICLEEKYKELVMEGINGKKIIKQTLIKYSKSNKN